ncbi:MAG: hypothetical protein RLZZ508_718 [Actinomycetota bacterium]|jgi:hypothetical protein
MSENQKKQEIVLTPLPKDKKISEMTRAELLALVATIREGMTSKQ